MLLADDCVVGDVETAIPAPEKEQRRVRRLPLEMLDPADEQGMVAGRVDRDGPADERCQGTVDDRQVVYPVVWHVVEDMLEIAAPPGEAVGPRLVLLSEHADGEPPV